MPTTANPEHPSTKSRMSDALIFIHQVTLQKLNSGQSYRNKIAKENRPPVLGRTGGRGLLKQREVGRINRAGLGV